MNNHNFNWEDYYNKNNNFKPDYNKQSIEGINALAKYLYAAGGPAQQSRMITDKRKTLDRVIKYSYQGAFIQRIGEKTKPAPALINPNKLKQDYDDKVLSIGFEYNFQPGDIFEWCQTGTYWLIYLQDLTELAYFRGDIRKCSYQIVWIDEQNEEHKTYAAIRGPVETKINYIQKHTISLDEPNYSLNILMPKTESAVNYFKRYSKFYLQGSETCWRVEAVDQFSTPGILEVTAVEYYANETEDDIEQGLVGHLIMKQEDPNTEEENTTIRGDTFIKPKIAYQYKFVGIRGNKWTIDTKKYPIRYSINPEDDREIKLIWDSPYSGQFDITCGNVTKTIVVESLF